MRQRINISARQRLYDYIEAQAREHDLPVATVAEQLLYESMLERLEAAESATPTKPQHTTRPQRGQHADASTFGVPGLDQRERSRPGEPQTPDEHAQVLLETKGPAHVRRLLEQQQPPHWNHAALARVLSGE